ncbi:MAG: crossover junction endodeoxyribonuclease RuvC [Alphaproteobacteria bacterium]
MTRIIGLDPGLRHTGWGIIESSGTRLSHIAHGIINAHEDMPMAARLTTIHEEIMKVLKEYAPQEAAVEEVFVNKNPLSTLKLGMARGIALMSPAFYGIPVAEYGANKVKKSIVGNGHAEKEQVASMVSILLPGVNPKKDAADALAIAICHAHYRSFNETILKNDCKA